MFKKSMKRLNVTWWAYSFPLTFLGLACAEYAQEVESGMASWLMLVICMVSVLVFIALMIITVLKIERLFHKNAPIMTWKWNVIQLKIEWLKIKCSIIAALLSCSLCLLSKGKEKERNCKERMSKQKIIKDE